MKKVYQIITNKFTAGIEVEDNKILKTAPILKAFEGQKVTNLCDWLDDKIGEYTIKEVK